MFDRSSARIFAGALAVLSFPAFNTACSSDPDKPTTKRPVIVQFSAAPSMVVENEISVLTYEVTDAVTIKIDIEGGANLLPETNDLSGTIETPRLTERTTFVLTAVNGDETVTESVQVSIEAPGHATIISFDAMQTTIPAGSAPNLRWLTLNARSGTIRQGFAEIYTIGETELVSGMFTAPAINADTTYTLAIKGMDNVEVTRDVSIRIGVTLPVINSFTATPSTITAGETSMLAWSVSDATEVTVTGPASGEVYRGTNLNGSVSVMPAATETFTITAVNGSGTDTDIATVTVNNPMGAVITSFTASPSTIDIGNASTLSWSVTNAPGGIRITAGATVVTTSMSETGTYPVSPGTTTTYTLRAINAGGGDATATAVVTVNAGAPVIVYFHASLGLVGRNQTTQLGWRTAGADEIRIYANDAEIYNTTTSLDLGTYDATVADLATSFRLEASNASGTNTFTIQVQAHDLPVINSFTANPTSYSGPTPITLTWDVGSANFLALYEGGIVVPGFPVVSTGTTAGVHTGTFNVTVSSATSFVLVARSAAGESRATIDIVGAVNEFEPNNTSTTAQAIPGTSAVTSAIGVAGDVDYYSFTVPTGGYVIAYTSDGAGGCPFDTVLYLYGPDGTTQLAYNDDADGGSCSRIDGRTTAAARNLPAGTYFIQVRAYSASVTGMYTLSVRSGGPGCGNGIPESAEQCDDGNLSNGDGCTSLCRYEVDGTFNVPTPVNYAGAISPAGDIDTYLVVVTATASVDIEVFTPTAAGANCDINDDTILRLYDVARNPVTSDDDGGIERCSHIASYELVPGTYFLTIEEYGNDAIVPAYEIVFRTFSANVCGNGVVEAGNAEECDDFNTIPADGCSATCTLEINPTIISGTGGTVTVDLTTPTAIAFLRVDLATQGQGISATAADVGGTTCNNADTAIDLLNGDFTVRGIKDDGGPIGVAGDCGAILFPADAFGTNLGGMTYYLAVFNADGTVGQVQVDVQIHNPGCGNGAVESYVAETCDDGNTNPGDGCSATCTLEGPPATTVNEVEPNADFGTAQSIGMLTVPSLTDISASFDAAGNDEDYFSFTTAVAAQLVVNTYGTSGQVYSSCQGDTVMYLYDGPTTGNQIGYSDDDGFGTCSIISGDETAPTRIPIPAGTYYLYIYEYGGNPLAQYYVRIDLQ